MGDKTKEKGAEGQNDETIDPALLEKSWKSSLEELRKSVNPDGEDLSKAKKPKVAELEAGEEEGEAEDNVAEEEDEAGEEAEEKGKGKGKEKVKKSLADEIAAEDPEAEAAMDIEPFLKSLANQIGKKTLTLEDAVGKLAVQLKVQGKALLSSMEMQKSLSDQIAIIGGQPVPVKGVLQKGGGAARFAAPAAGDGAAPELNKQEVMLKAMDLVRQGKMESRSITILEGRLNHGQGIPEELQPLFATAEGGK